jgi:AbrB family looped-hinge helix DNA binding protein
MVVVMHTVKVDLKGRLTIPHQLRKLLNIEPGDTLVVDYDEEHKMLHYAKAENPFDRLAEHALAERRAGRTRNLREFAAENDILLDVD